MSDETHYSTLFDAFYSQANGSDEGRETKYCGIQKQLR